LGLTDGLFAACGALPGSFFLKTREGFLAHIDMDEMKKEKLVSKSRINSLYRGRLHGRVPFQEKPDL